MVKTGTKQRSQSITMLEESAGETEKKERKRNAEARIRTSMVFVRAEKLHIEIQNQ